VDPEQCVAQRGVLADVERDGGGLTHMTAASMCLFARDLVEAARRAGASAVALQGRNCGIGIICAGWSRSEAAKYDAHGLSLFQRVTADMFRSHFEIEHAPQLRIMQTRAWKALGVQLKREFIVCALAGMESRARRAYTETHPDFTRFLAAQRERAVRRRARTGAQEELLLAREEGSSSSA
jgi:hypothetical protein